MTSVSIMIRKVMNPRIKYAHHGHPVSDPLRNVKMTPKTAEIKADHKNCFWVISDAAFLI